MNSAFSPQITQEKDIQQCYSIIRALTNNLRSVMYIMDINGNILFLSPSIKQLLGFDESHFLGTNNWMQLIHPEDASVVTDLYNDLSELTDFKATFKIRRSDGTYLMVSNTGSVKKENGVIAFFIGNLQETNSTKVFGHSQENPLYYLDQLMSSLGVSFFTINPSYQITSRNKIFFEWMKKETGIGYETGDSFFTGSHHGSFETEIKTLFDLAFKGDFIQEIITINQQHLHIAMSPLLMGDKVAEVAVMLLNTANYSPLSDTTALLKNSLYSIINTSEENIYTLDTDYRILSFNQSYKQLYRDYYNEDPVIGAVSRSFTGSAEVNRQLQKWYQQGMNGVKVEEELVFNERILRIIINPIQNTEGKVIGISVNSKDITLLRESVQKLAESESKYKYIVDHVTDIIFQTDNSGNWIYLNKAWQTIMEFSLDETIGVPFFNFLHPDDVEKNQRLFTPLINREKSYCSHEIRYITKSGKIKWIRVFATLLLDQDNHITGTTGTLKDITSEKEHSYLYELLSKNVNDLVCVHEIDATYIYVSPTIQSISGYQPEEMIGKNPFDFFHPDDRETMSQIHNSMNQVMKEDVMSVYRFRNKSGGYNWFETSARSLYDDFYGRNLLITSSRVIDERKRVEQQMLAALEIEKQLSELKSKFVAMASHEFRTPMTSIKSGAEIAEMYLEKYDDENILKARKFIKNIDSEVDRLSELINDVLLLSKLESDTEPLSAKETDMEELIRKSIVRQNSLQNDHRVAEFFVSGTARKPILDATHISHVLDNLLSNAFKYSIGKPQPEVHLIYKEEELEVLIKDYGIGIPPDEHNQIFNSFYRAKNTGSVTGTGIGLVLVHNFISMHKGRIYFESELGKGSSFHVVLPYVMP